MTRSLRPRVAKPIDDPGPASSARDRSVSVDGLELSEEEDDQDMISGDMVTQTGFAELSSKPEHASSKRPRQSSDAPSGEESEFEEPDDIGEDYAHTPAEARKMERKYKRERAARQAAHSAKKRAKLSKESAKPVEIAAEVLPGEKPVYWEWKEGQRMNLLQLPSEIIEQCFSLDQRLHLADFLSLGQTCTTFRDSMDDLAWESIVTLSRSNRKKELSDSWSLSATQNVQSRLVLGNTTIRFDRTRYCNHIQLGRAKDFPYRGLRMGSVVAERSPPSADERMLEMARELNALRQQQVPQPVLELPRVEYNFERTATEVEREAHKAACAAAQAKHEEKTAIWNDFMAEACRVQLKRVPLSRKEQYDRENVAIRAVRTPSDTRTGEDAVMDIDAPNVAYSPWKVIAIRKINYPVVNAIQAMEITSLTMAEVSEAVQHVPAVFVDYDGTNINHLFYKKDIYKLARAMAPVTAEREAKKQALLDAEAKRKLEVHNQEQARYERLKHPTCPYCDLRHPAGHSHYRQLGITFKKSLKKRIQQSQEL